MSWILAVWERLRRDARMNVHGDDYDAYYFSRGCGRKYQRDEYWLSFFGDIAEQIVGQLKPKAVLDAGCAMGFLVEGLRARGVEAFGIDVSAYAIGQVDPSIRPYCEIKSVIEPLSRNYDLIVCIEVLEHLPPEDAHKAIANLCAHTSDILFSSSPDDYAEPTHLNVQPPEYWAQLFAQHGFFRDTEQEPFVTPWSIRFRKTNDPFPRIVGDYERRLWRLERESRASREIVLEQRRELAEWSESPVSPEEALGWLVEAFFRASAVGVDDGGPTPIVTAEVPIAVTSLGDVAHVQRDGHSLWCMRDQDSALRVQADLQRGTYRLNGRALTTSDGRLELDLAEPEPLALLTIPGSIRDFSIEISLNQPTDGFELQFSGCTGFAALGDFHVVRVIEPGSRNPLLRRVKRIEERARAPLTRSAVAWVKRHPGGARFVRSRVGRFLQRVVGPLPPVSDSYKYGAWINERVAWRSSFYTVDGGPSFSLLTSVWNTPAEYLRELGDSVLKKQDCREFEWILLDNGSTDSATVAVLSELGGDEHVRLVRVDENLGIVGGMRYCLDRAVGDYVLPVDSDDLLYPDALRVMAWHIEEAGRPPLLFSDEDKLYEGRRRDPYFKSAWDPVLFLNSCYIAHLCAIDRSIAIELGLYSDAEAEGCHDWDSFTRFMLAGKTPVHVPEVLYSWRMHPASAALNINSKPYVSASHRSVLRGFLLAQPNPERYYVAPSPLFDGTPDWWFRRKHSDPRPILSVVLGDGKEIPQPVPGYLSHHVVALSLDAAPAELSDLVAREGAGALVHLVADGVDMDGDEWPWEALAITELHPDTVVVGGRVYDDDKRIVAAGEYLGFGGDCACPDIGRHIEDPGYFAYMWKQRSVSAASTMLAIVDAGFLREAIDAAPGEATLAFLGAWAGAHAARTHARVVYSPHVSGRRRVDRAAWQSHVTSTEREAFVRLNADVIPERRFLSPLLSLEAASAYQPVPAYTPPRGYELAGRSSLAAQSSGVR